MALAVNLQRGLPEADGAVEIMFAIAGQRAEE
jgi:hypothetical protein